MEAMDGEALEALDAEIIFIDRDSGMAGKFSPNPDGQTASFSLGGDTPDKDIHYPYVLPDINHDEGESVYKITILEKVRDSVDPKKTAFVAAATIGGVALWIIRRRLHNHNK